MFANVPTLLFVGQNHRNNCGLPSVRISVHLKPSTQSPAKPFGHGTFVQQNRRKGSALHNSPNPPSAFSRLRLLL